MPSAGTPPSGVEAGVGLVFRTLCTPTPESPGRSSIGGRGGNAGGVGPVPEDGTSLPNYAPVTPVSPPPSPAGLVSAVSLSTGGGTMLTEHFMSVNKNISKIIHKGIKQEEGVSQEPRVARAGTPPSGEMAGGGFVSRIPRTHAVASPGRSSIGGPGGNLGGGGSGHEDGAALLYHTVACGPSPCSSCSSPRGVVVTDGGIPSMSPPSPGLPLDASRALLRYIVPGATWEGGRLFFAASAMGAVVRLPTLGFSLSDPRKGPPPYLGSLRISLHPPSTPCPPLVWDGARLLLGVGTAYCLATLLVTYGLRILDVRTGLTPHVFSVVMSARLL